MNAIRVSKEFRLLYYLMGMLKKARLILDIQATSIDTYMYQNKHYCNNLLEWKALWG